MPMSWKIPVSPSQRVLLFNLLAPRAAEIADAVQGRIFRRVWKSFGLQKIDDAQIKSKRGISTDLMQSKEPALHEISIDTADYLFDKIVNRPRFPGEVLQLSEIFDAIDFIRDKKEQWEGAPTDGIPDYDPSKEDWAPAALDARGELIVAMAVMADVPVEKRAETWGRLVGKVGGRDALCIAAENLVEEIRTATEPAVVAPVPA